MPPEPQHLHALVTSELWRLLLIDIRRIALRPDAMVWWGMGGEESGYYHYDLVEKKGFLTPFPATFKAALPKALKGG